MPILNTMISTGKAANICNVTPDTVLKWIKSGRLPGIKTAGGHYRINPYSLEPFTAEKNSQPLSDLPTNPAITRKLNCWEFNTINGVLNRRCLKCIVYHSKSEKCYVLAAQGKRIGHEGIFCKSRCKKCRYYRYVKSTIKILIISSDWVQYKFCKTTEDCNVDVRFACCGYEVARVVQQFQPSLIVLDCSLQSAELQELTRHLKTDTRLTEFFMVFILSGTYRSDKLPREIDAVLTPPFSIPDLKQCLYNLQQRPKVAVAS